jgi:hypothetical protein
MDGRSIGQAIQPAGKLIERLRWHKVIPAQR